ncbi:hypothetical protein [Cohnella herbarum]|uniref:Fungal lipase-like domain-containing protein n=1 Tax=Cohnella herbarum TaxID=2728023 RepID=A0A7Z2VIF7_9BACL|nr:hypothetical protein [Cohnella herbarum]QJD83823.1 hypothetical protein HH215_11950 [Cohnella herbarum]
MSLPPAKISNSIGGKRAIAAMATMRLAVDRRTTTLLIGHSGGGVAAIHAAYLLMKSESRSNCLVVMIGSPKCRIPQELRPSVLSISAAGTRKRANDAEGKSPDLVSRLGTHGGWMRTRHNEINNHSAFRNGFPAWHKHKHAPAAMRTVPIIGGHADYFRDSSSYVNSSGSSNLDITLDAILSWLIQWNQTSFR